MTEYKLNWDSDKAEKVTFYQPPKPEWVMMPNGKENLQINVMTAPNAVHRFMQRVILGIKWKRYEDRSSNT